MYATSRFKQRMIFAFKNIILVRSCCCRELPSDTFLCTVKIEFLGELFTSSIISKCNDFCIPIMFGVPNRSYLVWVEVFCKEEKLFEVMQSFAFETYESDS